MEKSGHLINQIFVTSYHYKLDGNNESVICDDLKMNSALFVFSLPQSQHETLIFGHWLFFF